MVKKKQKEETYLPCDNEWYDWEDDEGNPILAKTVRKVSELMGKAKAKTKKMAIAEMIDILEGEGYIGN